MERYSNKKKLIKAKKKKIFTPSQNRCHVYYFSLSQIICLSFDTNITFFLSLRYIPIFISF